MKKIVISLLIIGTMAFSGCNNAVKKFGGTMKIDLPKGKKLVNITWKDSDLWYLTRDMNDNDKAETYEFQEKSNIGIKNGKVIIKETK